MASVTHPALTTTFTPPASCLNNVFVTGNVSAHSYILTLGPPDGSSVCWPSGWNTRTSSYFSPGYICPSGMYSAFENIPAVTTAGLQPETQIVCCPNSYSYYSTLNAFVGEQCSSQVTVAAVVTIFTADAVGGVHTTTLSVAPGDGVNAYGLNMRFRANDLITATSTSSSSSTSASTSTPTSTSSSATPTPAATTDTGLSTGAKAGIGIGVAIGVLAVFLIAFFFGRRSRRSRNQPLAYDPVHTGAPPAAGSPYSDYGGAMREHQGSPQMNNGFGGGTPLAQGQGSEVRRQESQRQEYNNWNANKLNPNQTYEMQTARTPTEMA